MKNQFSNVNIVVLNKNRWEDLFSGLTPTPSQIRDRVIINEDVWCALTYVQLKNRGYDIQISDSPLENAMNITDGVSTGSRHYNSACFFIGCRSDGHFPAFSQIVVHQNTLLPNQSNVYYVPQWPQPGLIPRRRDRKGIQTIGYFGGVDRNLSSDFTSDNFLKKLADRNIEFVIRGKSAKQVHWHDYSDIDLVLAVRNISYEHLLTKPVNKLTNSWLAGVPALLGREPAMQHIKESDFDYLEVSTAEEAIAAIDKLLDNPKLYEKYVTHGLERAQDWTEDKVSDEWVRLLSIANREFEQWSQKKKLTKWISFGHRAIRHRWFKYRHKKKIKSSYKNTG